MKEMMSKSRHEVFSNSECCRGLLSYVAVCSVKTEHKLTTDTNFDSPSRINNNQPVYKCKANQNEMSLMFILTTRNKAPEAFESTLTLNYEI